jgi:hypothetical protein
MTRWAYALEAGQHASVSISAPRDYFMPWARHQAGERVHHHFYLTISNTSTGVIKNCSIQEWGFVNKLKHEAPNKGRYLRLRSERSAEPAIHSFTRAFDLRGKGDEIDIDICSMDEGDPNSRVVMYYATSATDQQKNAIIRSLFPHKLTVRVTAENLAYPVFKEFEIAIEGDGQLVMRELL